MLLLEDKNYKLNITLEELRRAKKEITKLNSIVSSSIEVILQLKNTLYSKKSEKLTEDVLLMPELISQFEILKDKELIEAEQTVEQIEKKLTIKNKSSNKKKVGRKKLPDNIPCIEYIHDIPDSEKNCPCGCNMKFLRYEDSVKLHYLAAVLWKELHRYPVLACSGCEGDERTEAGKILITPQRKPQFYPKSHLTPSLFTFIIISKYVDHLPLYRIEQMFKRLGVNISRATLCNWVIGVYNLYGHLFSFLIDHLKSGFLIGCDETTLQVLKEKQKLSYLWVLRGGSLNKPVILFQYQNTRSAKFLVNLLKDFNGVLQTDAYSSYEAHMLGSCKLAGCMDHARRKFVDVWKCNKDPVAGLVLLYMKRLYRVERIIKNAKLYESGKFEHIVKIRQRLSAEFMNKIHKLLIINKDKLLSSISFKKAINYTLNNWDKLTVFLSNGHVPISNILVENNIRPVALGRKNWMFSVSPLGAKASAFFYSIMETFKANKIDPDKALRQLLEELPNCKTSEEVKKVFEKILGWT